MKNVLKSAEIETSSLSAHYGHVYSTPDQLCLAQCNFLCLSRKQTAGVSDQNSPVTLPVTGSHYYRSRNSYL